MSETHSELKVLLEESLLQKIEELRGLLAHTKPHASIKELLAFAVEQTLNSLRPKAPSSNKTFVTKYKSNTAKVKKGNDSPKPHRVVIHSRYISREIKRQVWQRDRGRCTFKAVSGRQCCSTHGLEYDHIHPFSLGGPTSTENLRLRCRAHNQLAAVQTFGIEKISSYGVRCNGSDNSNQRTLSLPAPNVEN